LARNYTVSIASASGIIRGSATVTITQETKTLPGGITVLPPAIPGDAVINLTGPAAQILWLDGTITASVDNDESFEGFTWYIDNLQTTGQTSAAFAANAHNYTLGTHRLMVVAIKTDDHKSYSRTVNFTIVKE
jgi:hypothetical protein